MPVKLGGMGFRNLEETSRMAFLGTVEQTVPFFSSQEAWCPQVTGFLGGEESFGEAAAVSGVGRWSHMLQNGGRLGEEVRRSWEELKLEATQAATWLEDELEGVLVSEVEDFALREPAERG